MTFLRNRCGTTTAEWLIVAIIVVAVVGGVLYTLFTTLRAKFQAVNDAL